MSSKFFIFLITTFHATDDVDFIPGLSFITTQINLFLVDFLYVMFFYKEKDLGLFERTSFVN